MIVRGSGRLRSSIPVTPPPATPPAAVGSVEFDTPTVGATVSDVEIIFSLSELATSYRYTAGASAGLEIFEQNGSGVTASPIILQNVPNGTELFACVFAVNEAGESGSACQGNYTVPVSAGTATQLGVLTQPGGQVVTAVAIPIQPVVRTLDASGVPISASGVTVTASIGSGTGSLSGTTGKVTDANGNATYTDLVVTGTGAHTLTFTPDGGLTPVNSSPFNVAAESSGLTDDGFYIYTRETVDANTILAEDFSRGSWYTKNCDDANGSGGLGQAGVHGWCGTIYASINPAGAVRDLGGGEYAATTGVGPGGTKMMADHTLKEAVPEMWLRFYSKPLAGYDWGGEKFITINSTNAGNGGISIGGLGIPFEDGVPRMCPWGDCNNGPVFYYNQNQGNAIGHTNGRWLFIEVHVKLNTAGSANGEYHLWLDDCGSGTLPVNPGGVPTLRASHTGVTWILPDEGSKLIRSIWFECWSNPVSIGERYWRSIYVSKGGQVGFSTNP